MDDIKSFRQWDSRTPGHPENFLTSGVEVTTGEYFEVHSASSGRSALARNSVHCSNRHSAASLYAFEICILTASCNLLSCLHVHKCLLHQLPALLLASLYAAVLLMLLLCCSVLSYRSSGPGYLQCCGSGSC
jgi:hypothetical protein